jgi:SAM-dependent methyltransferase
VDVRHDFLRFPYPFPDASFDEVYTHHVMEHVPPKLVDGDRDAFYAMMDEIHRVLRPGGVFTAVTPFAGSMSDHCHVAHYRHFVPETWQRFCRGYAHSRESEGYSDRLFTMKDWKITKWEPRFPYSWPVGKYRRHPMLHLFVRVPWLVRHGVFGRPAELRVTLQKPPAP